MLKIVASNWTRRLTHRPTPSQPAALPTTQLSTWPRASSTVPATPCRCASCPPLNAGYRSPSRPAGQRTLHAHACPGPGWKPLTRRPRRTSRFIPPHRRPHSIHRPIDLSNEPTSPRPTARSDVARDSRPPAGPAPSLHPPPHVPLHRQLCPHFDTANAHRLQIHARQCTSSARIRGAGSLVCGSSGGRGTGGPEQRRDERQDGSQRRSQLTPDSPAIVDSARPSFGPSRGCEVRPVRGGL